ncbi:MAG: formylglycine-generating enzyme family protein, partial [Alphaproteobacteria bacterium]
MGRGRLGSVLLIVLLAGMAGAHPTLALGQGAKGGGSDQMVRIPGGTSTIGTDDGLPDERPAHQVTLEPFWIDRYEVTN